MNMTMGYKHAHRELKFGSSHRRFIAGGLAVLWGVGDRGEERYVSEVASIKL